MSSVRPCVDSGVFDGGVFDAHVHVLHRDCQNQFAIWMQQTKTRGAAVVSLPDPVVGTFNAEVKQIVEHCGNACVAFGCLDYRDCADVGDPVLQVRSLHDQGFCGLKLWIGKPLVETWFAKRLTDSWIGDAVSAAAALGMPVLVHSADPPVFWDTHGVYAHGYDPFERYIDDFEQLVSNHADASFIGAHLLFLAGSLENLSRLLDTYPLLFVDTAPGRWWYRELAMAHERACTWFGRYRKRVLLGSDALFQAPGQTLFAAPGLEENVRTATRIRDFLAMQDGTVDDPFPANQVAGSGELAALGLGAEVFGDIAWNNASALFGLDGSDSGDSLPKESV